MGVAGRTTGLRGNWYKERLLNVRLLDLRYFVAVAEEGSFTRAADSLYVAQQAVSAQVRELEKRLGVELVDRHVRPLKLTSAGEVFLDHARRLLEAADEALEATLKAAGGGTLRVGFVPGAALELTQPILSRFSEAHPQARIELRQSHYADSSGGVQSGDVDVAFVRAPFSSEGLWMECLAKEPRVLALAVGHPLARKPAVCVQDIIGQTLIAARIRDRVVRTFWIAADERKGLGPSDLIEAATYEEQLELVAAGRGVSITGAAAARYYARPELVYRPFTDLGPCDIAAVWRAGDTNALVSRFLDAARSVRDAETGLVERIARGIPVAV
jgi:DNA-binding transcriptional LysR family regulator